MKRPQVVLSVVFELRRGEGAAVVRKGGCRREQQQAPKEQKQVGLVEVVVNR